MRLCSGGRGLQQALGGLAPEKRFDLHPRQRQTHRCSAPRRFYNLTGSTLCAHANQWQARADAEPGGFVLLFAFEKCIQERTGAGESGRDGRNRNALP